MIKTLKRLAGPRPLLALTAICVLALAAGCGGDDRLTNEELAKRLNQTVDRISGEFAQVFQRVGRRGENEQVPAPAKQALERAADVERRSVDEIAELEPPEDAEEATNRLIDAARAQADQLDRLAREEELTVKELADALEFGPTRDALEELRRKRLVKPEQHR